MKRLIAAIVLLEVVIGLSVSSAITTNRCYYALTGKIEEIEAIYENKESTEKQLSALKDYWEKTEPVLMFFANHGAVEEIGIRIDRLVSLSDTDEESAFKTEAVELKSRLKYLKDSESLTFESVF